MHAGNSYYRLSGPNGPEMAKLKLKQVLASDRSIVTAVEKTVNKEQMDGVMRGPGGGGSGFALTSSEADVQIDTGIYYARSADMIQAVHGMFITEIYKARDLPPPARAAGAVKSALVPVGAAAK